MVHIFNRMDQLLWVESVNWAKNQAQMQAQSEFGLKSDRKSKNKDLERGLRGFDLGNLFR